MLDEVYQFYINFIPYPKFINTSQKIFTTLCLVCYIMQYIATRIYYHDNQNKQYNFLQGQTSRLLWSILLHGNVLSYQQGPAVQRCTPGQYMGTSNSVRSPSRAPDASRKKAMVVSQPLQLVHLMLQHYWATSS